MNTIKIKEKFKDLLKIFRPDIKIKRVKRVYDKDGTLREEIIESNVSMNLDKIDDYFKKMDEAFEKMGEAFRCL